MFGPFGRIAMEGRPVRLPVAFGKLTKLVRDGAAFRQRHRCLADGASPEPAAHGVDRPVCREPRHARRRRHAVHATLTPQDAAGPPPIP